LDEKVILGGDMQTRQDSTGSRHSAVYRAWHCGAV